MKETTMEPTEQKMPPSASRTARSRELNFVGYQNALDRDSKTWKRGATLVNKAAHALHWAAEHFPRQFVALNILLKAINNYPHMPQLRTKEVATLRGAMSRVRIVLHEVYGRGLVTERGLGVRATVDSEDQLKTDVVSAAGRLAASNKAFQRAGGLVDIKTVPSTPENKPWIAWFNGEGGNVGLRGQLAAIPAYINLLQPPVIKPIGEDDKKKKK